MNLPMIVICYFAGMATLILAYAVTFLYEEAKWAIRHRIFLSRQKASERHKFFSI